jgi:hypothetical protein
MNKAAQWILWAVTMAIFLGLTLTAHWHWLIAAMLLASLVSYTVVPQTHSRRE